MKNTFAIFIFILFQNLLSAQSECPNQKFLGKWTDDKFGIEIKCDRIIILDKINDWALSEKRSDTYYYLKPIMNEDEIYVTWVQNYAMYDFFSKGKWQKTSSKQQRVFKIEKDNDDIIFSMSEKKIQPNGLKGASNVNIIKEGEVFEKSFNLKKLEQGTNH